jgi:chromate transporter
VDNPAPARPTVAEIFLAALRLGCTSFGGPVAHLAYFRRDYVERRRWISEADYAELVALCQFLPGPASSQTGFGIGYRLRGWAGGWAAWAGFTLPSAVLMTAFALGLTYLGDLAGAGWLHGLKLAAAAVVAHAVLAMWRAFAPDAVRSLVVVGAAVAVLVHGSPVTPVLVIAAGAVAGLALGGPTLPVAASRPNDGRAGLLPLTLFAVLLVALPVAARLAAPAEVALANACYRAGTFVFGGGHVVLPLLEREFVGADGVSSAQFLAGYGAAQAVPGPLFTFATYLGAVQAGPTGALVATVAIFLPGLLLVAGVLPVWERLRRHAPATAAFRGANAAVVGLLAAAFVHPVSAPARGDAASAAVAVGAFLLLQFTRLPAWAVVGLCAVLGAIGRE